jgi:heme/copper-type cytochrome/quinol oxidase subunit 3
VRSEPALGEANAKLYMGLFMASWSIGFFALLVANLYFRLDAVTWPPAGAPEPPVLVGGLATLVALASSAAYHWGLTGIEPPRASRARLVKGLFAATALAFVFLLVQLGAGLAAATRGLVWDRGVYAAFFWITAGFHYLHVVVGFAAGLWLALRARSGAYGPAAHLPVRLWGYYWHSIGLIWVLIYLFLFLL